MPSTSSSLMLNKWIAALLLVGVSTLCSASTVSILSLLSPRHAQLVLRKPAILTVTGVGQNPTARSELAANKTLEVALSAGALLLDATERAARLNLACEGGCLTDIHVAGMSRVYHGDMTLQPGYNTIQIVLTIEEEELVGSIVESERLPTATPESLRALAVVARSFLGAGSRHAGVEFCDTTHCQVFQGLVAGPEVREAVSATSGMILLYNGRPFRPYYSRSCGGKTATYLEVWGRPSPDYPFVSVACPCSRDESTAWTTRVGLPAISEITGLPNAKLNRSGDWITITSGANSRRYSVENFRTLLGRTKSWALLPGNRFETHEDSGTVVFTGRGAGHGVGLCLVGAEMLSREGNDFRKILLTYFPGTTVAVK